MVFVAVVAGVLGAVAARSIVAESDAHRFELSDRWIRPVCDECGASLTIGLTSCTTEHHKQRVSNVAVLVGTVTLSVAFALWTPTIWVLPAYLVFLWSMILLTVTDFDTKLIPNRILGRAIVVSAALLVVGHLIDGGGSLLDAAIGAASYFGAMYLLAIVARGGFGFGDVKLAFMIGIFVGYLSLGHTLVAGIGSFFIGGAVSLLLVVTRLRSRKDSIPFGPFMTAAAVITVLFGQDIINWYLR